MAHVPPPMDETVTVVIACYEYGAYLEEAVGSALGQEAGAPHVVVVDDGSTDPHTLAVLDRLPPEVDVVRQANAGPSAARNAGLARATTPFLLALDADDRLTPSALGILLDELRGDPRLGFAYGVTRFFGDWNGTLTLPDYDPYKLLYRHMIGLTALMRREVYEDTGGYDTSLRSYEDWEFWLHALACGWRGRRVAATTLQYRRHGETNMASARREYRRSFAYVRDKHADLYATEDALARESGIGRVERALYRRYWGPRPVPVKLEQALYSALFRRARGGRQTSEA